MASNFGEKYKISIFGESHGTAIGVTIDSPPPGHSIDMDFVNKITSRRRPKTTAYSTKRKEGDQFEILSGFINGTTTGTPLTAIIRNSDQKSGDYDNLKNHPRPSHADYTGSIRYNNYNDFRGGGHFSGRLTAPLCIAGAIALDILRSRGISISAHIKSIGEINDTPFDSINFDADLYDKLTAEDFPVISDSAKEQMSELIAKTAKAGDSIGGVIQCRIDGMPAGIGSPIFGGIENVISSAMFGVPAVKGIEFGDGFDIAKMTGSTANDCIDKNGDKLVTTTNHNGGILGGISNGMPIMFSVAMKPTPSISLPQQTYNFKNENIETLVISGRHDPCIVPRAVPCIESAAAIAILNMIL